jgi:hypothetical protein
MQEQKIPRGKISSEGQILLQLGNSSVGKIKFLRACTYKSRLFGNRWCRKRRVQITLEAQAVRRHQLRRPQHAKIKPGRPAPAMGVGTLPTPLGIAE